MVQVFGPSRDPFAAEEMGQAQAPAKPVTEALAAVLACILAGADQGDVVDVLAQHHERPHIHGVPERRNGRLRRPPGRGHRQSERGIRGGLGQHTRGVTGRHAVPGARLQVDVVEADGTVRHDRAMRPGGRNSSSTWAESSVIAPPSRVRRAMRMDRSMRIRGEESYTAFLVKRQLDTPASYRLPLHGCRSARAWLGTMSVQASAHDDEQGACPECGRSFASRDQAHAQRELSIVGYCRNIGCWPVTLARRSRVDNYLMPVRSRSPSGSSPQPGPAGHVATWRPGRGTRAAT
jgi:hypothetical protein